MVCLKFDPFEKMYAQKMAVEGRAKAPAAAAAAAAGRAAAVRRRGDHGAGSPSPTPGSGSGSSRLSDIRFGSKQGVIKVVCYYFIELILYVL